MATIPIGPTNVKTVTQPAGLVAGPNIEALLADPNAAAPTAAVINPIIANIDSSIAGLAAANDPTKPSTALPPPNNFHFFDATVQVSNDLPGDAFKGATTGITSQTLDLTPDNIGITGVKPNFLAATGSGNDVLAAAAGGRNIMAAGSGQDTYIGGTGVGSVDTFIENENQGASAENIFNFHTGDDAVMVGVEPTDFSLSFTDTVFGLQMIATPTAAAAPTHAAASILLNGFTTADIGTKLTVGVNTSAATPYLFIHGN